MQATILYGPRDVRVEERPDPTILEPTDAVIRIAAACVCGSDLWPYRGVQPVAQPTPMGHEYCGVVEHVGGAVGLLGVLSAKQMGAERIIAMSRHPARQELARAFGATDVVTERGDEGVVRIKDLTKGIGADAVLECVGTQESMLQAIRATRP